MCGVHEEDVFPSLSFQQREIASDEKASQLRAIVSQSSSGLVKKTLPGGSPAMTLLIATAAESSHIY